MFFLTSQNYKFLITNRLTCHMMINVKKSSFCKHEKKNLFTNDWKKIIMIFTQKNFIKLEVQWNIYIISTIWLKKKVLYIKKLQKKFN